MSEVLWGLAAAGGTAFVGAMATDVWGAARLRVGGLLRRGEPDPERAAPRRPGDADADLAGAHTAQPESGQPPRSPWVWAQYNVAGDGGTQHITLSGDLNVGRDSSRSPL